MAHQKKIQTISVLGLGPVGRAFVQLCAPNGPRICSLTDRSGTLFTQDIQDLDPILRRKAEGIPLASQGGAKGLDPLQAFTQLRPDFVVDCTDTNLEPGEDSLSRSLRILDQGQALVSASKAALLADPWQLLGQGREGRYGFNAVLGGTGLELRRNLSQIQQSCTEIVAVPNACTTSVIQALEEGADLEAALAQARSRNLLEADPTQDLDGRDAAIKIATVAQMVFSQPIQWREIPRPSFEELDPDLLRFRKKKDLTTRLVCRTRADHPNQIQMCYEELPSASPFAIPWNRVLYTYHFNKSTPRPMLGKGVGAKATAQALLADLWDLAARSGPE